MSLITPSYQTQFSNVEMEDGILCGWNHTIRGLTVVYYLLNIFSLTLSYTTKASAV